MNCKKLCFLMIVFFGIAISSMISVVHAGTETPMNHGVSTKGITYIEAEDLKARLSQPGGWPLGFHLVDLRTEADYQDTFIPGAINIPYKKLSFMAEKLFGKSDEVVFYGYPKTDRMSVNAVIFMRNKGFEFPAVLRGGLGSWEGELEKRSRK